jgi:hypothetical protein
MEKYFCKMKVFGDYTEKQPPLARHCLQEWLLSSIWEFGLLIVVSDQNVPLI